MDLQRRDPHPALWVAGRDAYQAMSIDGKKQPVGVKSLLWSQAPDAYIRSGILVGASGLGGAARQTHATFSPIDDAALLVVDPHTSAEVTQLGGGGYIRGEGPFSTIGDIDGRNLSFYLTKPLFDLID